MSPVGDRASSKLAQSEPAQFEPAQCEPAQLRIRVRDDGPLVIEGPFTIVDAEGRPFALPTHKPFVALCRCGRSSTKPFCDGSHKSGGFEARQRSTQ